MHVQLVIVMVSGGAVTGNTRLTTGGDSTPGVMTMEAASSLVVVAARLLMTVADTGMREATTPSGIAVGAARSAVIVFVVNRMAAEDASRGMGAATAVGVILVLRSGGGCPSPRCRRTSGRRISRRRHVVS